MFTFAIEQQLLIQTPELGGICTHSIDQPVDIVGLNYICTQGPTARPLLLAWFNFNTSIDK